MSTLTSPTSGRTDAGFEDQTYSKVTCRSAQQRHHAQGRRAALDRAHHDQMAGAIVLALPRGMTRR